MDENKLPLGLCKQAFMKLESFMNDLGEILEDEDVTGDDRYEFQQMSEIATIMGLRLLNIIKKEIGEEDFVQENIVMDEIDLFPSLENMIEEPDAMDEEVDDVMSNSIEDE